MSSVKFTIITVCYNAALSIEKTMLSVRQQSYKNREYIIIDGQSTDDTCEIINRNIPSNTRLISGPDSGIYHAMNKGIALASGDLLYFLNSGDTFSSPDVLLHTAQTYEQSVADILFGGINITNPKGEIEETRFYHDLDLSDLYTRPICHQAIFVSRKAFSICGLYNLDYKFAADFDWLLSAAKKFRLRFQDLDFTIANFDNSGVSSRDSEDQASHVRVELRKVMRTHIGALELIALRIHRKLGIRKRSKRLHYLLATALRWKLY